MPTITDLATIKRKLQIASSEQDDAITDVWKRAEAWVLNETGLALAAVSVVEIFERVQIESPFTVHRAPIGSLTSVEGRYHGATTWSTLTGDVLDANAGRLVIVGGLGTLENWPPRDPRVDVFTWRDFIWPLVRVTYTTAVLTAPDDLKDATAALAAYWYERDQAGILKSVSLDRSVDTYLTDMVPAWLQPIFSGYTPKPPSWV